MIMNLMGDSFYISKISYDQLCLHYLLSTGLVGLLITVGFLVIMSSVGHNDIPINNNSLIFFNFTKEGICKSRQLHSLNLYVSQQQLKIKGYVFKAFLVCLV